MFLEWKMIYFVPLMLLLLTLMLITVTFRTNAAQAAFPGTNGKIAFTSYHDISEIYVINPDGTGLDNLTHDLVDDSSPAFSPNGSRIVFMSTRDGNDEIYIMNADGTGQTRLTNNPGSDKEPSFSPDGSKIVFVRDWKIYIMNADGTSQIEIANDPEGNYEPAFSPDGSKIAFTRYQEGHPEIFVMNYDGTGCTRLTYSEAEQPAFSPDGSKISFRSTRDHYAGEIYIMNTDGTGQTRLTNNSSIDADPAFSPFYGSKITFASNRVGHYEIYVMNADGTAQTKVTNDIWGGYNVQPDWQPNPIFVPFPKRDYYFTWYDELGGDDWVLLANPVGAGDINASLSVAGINVYQNQAIIGGQTKISRLAGVMGGPVKATTDFGQNAIVSQRILWPNGGSSLEEVLGMYTARLSSHFYWTWYDESPGSGFKDWILIANNNPYLVYYQIKIAGATVGSGAIKAGENVTPRLPGYLGGPVDVLATGRVMASQRVLSNDDTAFNEVPGIPAEELSNHYLWTWYDDLGGRNWVLIANPNATGLYYEVWVDGQKVADDGGNPIPPGGKITPRFGIMGGPVEVKTFCNASHNDVTLSCSRSIASQRVLWGPSFEEVPGYDYHALTNSYHWTWYDQSVPGVSNWVLVTNPGTASVNAIIKIAGNTVWSGSISAGGQITPTFPGKIGGPVEVSASGPVMASQRVLWKGFFNEVQGSVL